MRRFVKGGASIERYMRALETADREDGELAQAESARLKDKSASLWDQLQAFKAWKAPLSTSRYR